ncbi:hypothetical protein Zmor_004908 [Zophobas morio]|uniref:BRICHOS domain-containing protein n=1 Tax=Zophobas morio TaxID=2755281 RepID=A0AA38MLF8_9CUCU|nr:hypothetical protein Zmor_004908 [Zophobas morio]
MIGQLMVIYSMARLILICVIVGAQTCAVFAQDGVVSNAEDPSQLNSIHKGSSKSRTLFDYQTRVVAYKDLIESRCLLGFIKGGESFVGQFSDTSTMENLTKNFLMAENQLSKRQILTIGGSRIVEFCRGFPTFLIHELSSDHQNSIVPEFEPEGGATRAKRSTSHFFVGRVRGQTQSQYLNFGNSKDPGKAEAESSYGSSKAVVSGSSGMGQAQSQSIPVGCDDCYGQDQGLQYGRTNGHLEYPGAQYQRPGRPGYPNGGVDHPGYPSVRPGEKPGYPNGHPNGKPAHTGYPDGGAGGRPQPGYPDGGAGGRPQPGYPNGGAGGRPQPGYPEGGNGGRPTGPQVPTQPEYPEGRLNGRPTGPQIPGYPNGGTGEGPHVPTQPEYPEGRPNGRPTGPQQPGYPEGGTGPAGPHAPTQPVYHNGRPNGRVPGYPEGERPTGPQVPTQPEYPEGGAGGTPTGTLPGYPINGRPTGPAQPGYPEGGNGGQQVPPQTGYPRLPGDRLGPYTVPPGYPGYPRPGQKPSVPQVPPQTGYTREDQYPGQRPTGPPKPGEPGYPGYPHGEVPGYPPQPVGPSDYPSISGQPAYPLPPGHWPGRGHPGGKFSGQFAGDYLHQAAQGGRFSGTFAGEYEAYQNGRANGRFGETETVTGGTKYPGGHKVPERITYPGLPGSQQVYPGAQPGGNGRPFIPGSDVGGQPGYPGTGKQPGYVPGQQTGYPGQPYPAGPGQLPSVPGQQPGYQRIPGQQSGYPGVTGQVPGVSGQQPGYTAIPGQQPVYPAGPGQVPSIPGQQTGYPGIPGQQPGYTGVPGVHPVPQPGLPGYPGVSGYPGVPGQESGYPGVPGVQTDYPAAPGGPPIHTGVQNGYLPTPGGQNGYPGVPGVQSGYPGTAGAQPGYPGVPGAQPGYPGVPGAQPGYPGVPGTQPGYPGIPGQQPGYTHGIPPGGQPPYSGGSGYGGDVDVYGRPGEGPMRFTEGEQVDDSDSQVLTSVQQKNNETLASASAQGRFQGGTAQSQVSGTYSGSGSFNALAGSDDGKRGALTQVSGGKEGAQSAAQGRGGLGQSQAQVQLASETGDTISSAQTAGWNHGSQTQVQASGKGGMSDAQANGPGSTSSQAQIGFTPYDEHEQENQTTPFGGGGMASAQSGTYSGQAQSQIQGKFQYGIRYTGAAQAGSGGRDGISGRNESRISSFAAFPEFKPLNFTADKSAFNTQSQVLQTNDRSNVQKTITRDSSVPRGQEVDQTTVHDLEMEETATDEYHDEEYDDYEGDYTTPKTRTKSIISQASKNQRQHIVLDPLEDLDATVQQSYGYPPDGTILQPGEYVPGSPGYQIPPGFRGRVKSVANGQNTYSTGKNSQAQSVTLTPGTGRVIYKRPIYAVSSNTHFRNGHIGFGSGYTYQPANYQVKSGKSLPNFVSLTKSETGSKNPYTGQKTPSVYYTQSSSCGVFTNTCVFNGNGKLCFPKPKTNPDGSFVSC